MEFDAESLKNGLPLVKEAPNCARCHGPKAFVVSQKHGIICGHCVESLDKEQAEVNEFIIREARQKMEEINGR